MRDPGDSYLGGGGRDRRGDAVIAVGAALRLPATRTQRIREFPSAADERDNLAPGDALAPHDLPEEVVDRLGAPLATERRVTPDCLARKVMHHLPDHTLYLVALRARRWGDTNNPSNASSRRSSCPDHSSR